MTIDRETIVEQIRTKRERINELREKKLALEEEAANLRKEAEENMEKASAMEKAIGTLVTRIELGSAEVAKLTNILAPVPPGERPVPVSVISSAVIKDHNLSLFLKEGWLLRIASAVRVDPWSIRIVGEFNTKAEDEFVKHTAQYERA